MPKILSGIVTKAKVMSKTATVTVARRVIDPRTKKTINKHTKYLVHDPNEQMNMNDRVVIHSCRPISHSKHYVLNEVLHKAVRGHSAEQRASTALAHEASVAEAERAERIKGEADAVGVGATGPLTDWSVLLENEGSSNALGSSTSGPR